MDGGEEEGEGKISPMCESIGHWPLQGRCPKRERDEGKVAEARDRDNEKKDRETKQKIYLGCHL